MTKRDLLIDFLGWYQRNTQEEGTCDEKWMDEATVDSYLNQPQFASATLDTFFTLLESINLSGSFTR
jgi:hypothetical protein